MTKATILSRLNIQKLRTVSKMQKKIAIDKIKKFNRFYFRMSGLFSLYSDESPYSPTEAMILFEINRLCTKCTASYLSNYFMLDKGYISRILNRFEQKQLIVRTTSEDDKRVKHLKLTEEGVRVLNDLANQASQDVAKLIKDIDEEDLKLLINAMETIERILCPKK